jgi:hypothetical protein
MTKAKMRPKPDMRLRVFSFMALAVASVVEFLQIVPAPFEWMHPAGEILRNVGYAVFAAYVFNYFLAERPERRRAAAAIRASISALESIATKPSRFFAACLQSSGVVLSQDVRTDDELADVMLKQLSDEDGETNPSALDLALLDRLLREVEERFASISPHLGDFPPDLAADVSRLRERFAFTPKYLETGFTLSAFLQPLRLGREFAQILIRGVNDRSLRRLLKPYASSFVQAERTAPKFEYSEEVHSGQGYFASYLNPVAFTRWELENERQLRVQSGQRNELDSKLMVSLEGNSSRSFGRDAISILRLTARELHRAWAAGRTVPRR